MDDSSNQARFRFLNLAPFGVEHSIEKRITPVIPDHPILHQNALSPHSDLIQNPSVELSFGYCSDTRTKLLKVWIPISLCLTSDTYWFTAFLISWTQPVIIRMYSIGLFRIEMPDLWC